jgi:hypothetical protein
MQLEPSNPKLLLPSSDLKNQEKSVNSFGVPTAAPQW